LIGQFGSSTSSFSSLNDSFSIPKANPWEQSQMASSDAFSIRQMLSCNMHLGHAVSKCNHRMNPFIWGEREGIHIIDLEKTLYWLRKAVSAIEELAFKGAHILFTAADPALERLVFRTATTCRQFYLNGPWTKGLIANREFLLGHSKYCPDLLVVLDHGTNSQPAQEAYDKLVPCIAVCDTNSDPSLVTWPIPANDDSIDGQNLVAEMLLRGVLAGQARAERIKVPKANESIDKKMNANK
jgi:small subunit ribosomal protein S2